MEKRFCDGPGCEKEIDENKGFYTLQSQYKERDYGITFPAKGVDFCSLRCLIAYAIEKRRAAVIREERTEENGKETVLYLWEGIPISHGEIEKKNGRFYLTEQAYKKYGQEGSR